MLSKRLLDELNLQVKYEFYSAHFYLAMAGYCYTQDLDGCANYMMVQAEEEKFHAMRFFSFVKNMDGVLDIQGLETPPNDYNDVLDVFERSLEHERFVTSRIYHLMDIATEEKEFATVSFLKWFIDEQVEEESNFKTIIQKLKRSHGDVSILYALDDEMKLRVFTPPVIV